MLFGRSLFGGALVAGFVALAGAAACTATATGDAAVLYKGRGAAQATAQASADALRSAIAETLSAAGTAHASAAPSASFLAAGGAQITALAVGITQAQFYGAGVAQASAYATGTAYRRLRMRFQPPAPATAFAEGEPVSYLIAYAQPAVARARLIGTTYHVGQGVALATAGLLGDAQKSIGARQIARAEATATARMLHIVGVGGQAAAVAMSAGYPAVTVNGVRHFDLFGTARATAYAPAARTLVFQPQTMRATALAQGTGVQTRGFKGVGVATARATGYMDMTYTGQVGSPALVTATATARAVRRVSGAGVANAKASAAVQPRCLLSAAGAAAGVAEGNAPILHFRLFPQRAAATAGLSGQMQRVVIAEASAAIATAEAAGHNQINDLAPAPERRTLSVLRAPRTTTIAFEDRTIRA